MAESYYIEWVIPQFIHQLMDISAIMHNADMNIFVQVSGGYIFHFSSMYNLGVGLVVIR